MVLQSWAYAHFGPTIGNVSINATHFVKDPMMGQWIPMAAKDISIEHLRECRKNLDNFPAASVSKFFFKILNPYLFSNRFCLFNIIFFICSLHGNLICGGHTHCNLVHGIGA